jgi:hypothetical protein
VLLAVMAVLAGCTGPGVDKAGGTRARQPVVLTLADFIGESFELDGFAGAIKTGLEHPPSFIAGGQRQ